MNPKIIIDNFDEGFHNKQIEDSINRLSNQGLYKDVSTICVIPTRGVIPARVVQNWWGLLTPMNQRFIRNFIIGMEVGHAYSSTVENILATEGLKDWKYMLTVEEDNILPPDALIKLIESIEGGVDGKKYDAVGGLYWTKGYGGQPMCYGNPTEIPMNFIPQIPRPDTITPCNGLGMGCTLFRIEMFKDPRFKTMYNNQPFFETKNEYVQGRGAACYTQDLNFFQKATELGYKMGCDSRVLVGHLDVDADIVW